jgi:hypothetical protein
MCIRSAQIPGARWPGRLGFCTVTFNLCRGWGGGSSVQILLRVTLLAPKHFDMAPALLKQICASLAQLLMSSGL